MRKVIGVDIGGTKILAGIVNENGQILKKISIPTEASKGRDVVLSNLFDVIDKLMTDEVLGIGIGSAGRINFKTGTVDYATNNLPEWTGFNIKKFIEKKYDLPVYVENDVNAAAIGEMWLGAARNTENFVMITIGTGLGGAVVIDNKIIHGKHFSTGEFGHMLLYPGGRKCNCGKNGCVERYVSGTAIYERYKELSFNNINNGKDVFKLLGRQDENAIKVIEEFTASLSNLMINLRNCLDLDKYLLGGGVVESRKYWWDSFINSIPADMAVEPAQLGNKATMLGAANLVLR